LETAVKHGLHQGEKLYEARETFQLSRHNSGVWSTPVG